MPQLDLQIGKVDPLRKVIYARIAGDPSVLSIPENFAGNLPQSPLAFRDRTVLSLAPTEIQRLTIHRDGTAIELASPSEPGTSTHWRMTAPVTAPADETAVTKVVLLLANLHADAYVTDQPGDGKPFGLHAPSLTVTWNGIEQGQTESAAKNRPRKPGTLRIGSQRPKTEIWYANIEGNPIVFTLNKEVVDAFEAEFRDHAIWSFRVAAARKLKLRWLASGAALTFVPQQGERVATTADNGKQKAGEGETTIRWVPEPGTDAPGFDISRIGALLGTLSKLSTPKFIQYQGPFPAESGLEKPSLEIEIETVSGSARQTRLLRIGRTTTEMTAATNAPPGENEGAIFLLTGPAWHDLVEHPPRPAPAG